MKNLIARVVSSAILATLVSVSAIASALPDGGPYEEKVGDCSWSFVVSGGLAELVSQPSNRVMAVSPNPHGKVVIPNELGGCAVVSIGDGAFAGCSLRSIVIPASVTNIGSYAFSNCTGLEAVYFKGNAPRADETSFLSCNLTSYVIASSTGWQDDTANLPEDGWPVGDGAQPITIWKNSPKTICKVTFDLGPYGERTGGGELAQSVAEGGYVTLPNVTGKDGWTFAGWSADMSQAVTDYTTVYARYDRSEPISSGAVTNEWFDGIVWKFSVNDYESYLTGWTYDGNDSVVLTTPTVLGGHPVTKIADYAFCENSSIERVVVSEGIQSIGMYALKNSSTTFVSLPDSLEDVGWGAFYNCTWLRKVCFGRNLKVVSRYDFSGCGMLETIDVGESDYVFEDGLLLTGDRKTLVLGIASLTNVVIPDSVETIDAYAFREGNLLSVQIGENVRSIEEYAFAYCNNLQAVYFEGDAPVAWYSIFYDSSYVTNYVRQGSFGWNGDELELPSRWPDRDYYGRPIAYWEGKDTITRTVTFDLGSKGRRTGGGALVQSGLATGSAAVAPEVEVDEGYVLNRWSADFSRVVSNMVVRAIYSRPGALADGGPYEEKLGKYTWNFYVADGGVTIRSSIWWNSAIDPTPQGEVVVPSELGGWPVRHIGSGAFYCCYGNNLSVIIPEGVVDIADYAFEYSYLRDISLPSTLQSIGNNVFYCSHLRKIVIPANVVSIGEMAFYSASSLTDISVSPENAVYKSIEGVLLSKDGSVLVHCPMLRTLNIPTGVKTIGDYACYGCKTANGVLSIPDGVEEIGCQAFANVDAELYIIPASVTKIGDSAFVATDDDLPNALYFKGNAPKSVNANAMSQAPDDMIIYVRSDSSGWGEDPADSTAKWPRSVGWNESSRRKLAVWENYPKVCHNVCFELGNLASRTGGGELEQQVLTGEAAEAPIVTPDDSTLVEFVGWNHDISCVSNSITVTALYRQLRAMPDGGPYEANVDGVIWRYTVNNGCATVGDGNVYDKTVSPEPTGDLVIPAELGLLPVTGIADYAFREMENVTTVTIPSGVQSIGSSAFYGMSSLTGFVVDEGNSTYKSVNGFLLSADGRSCIVGPKAVDVLEIPEGVANIYDFAFSYSDVREVVLPSTISWLGYYEFGYCYNLTNVILKAGCSGIDGLAFEGCESLTQFTIDNSDRNEYAFVDGVLYSADKKTAVIVTPSVVDLVLPDETEVIARYAAMRHSGSLRSVRCGEGLKDIKYGAFQNCYSLTNVVLNSAVETIEMYAFAWTGIESVVIPESLKTLGFGAFNGCVASIYFMGDAPASVNESPFEYSMTNLTVYVRYGSSGWNGLGDYMTLPTLWPTNANGNVSGSRPITWWEDEPPITRTITFDLGKRGIRSGGGELVQSGIATGSSAVEPTIAVGEGFEFRRWSADFSSVTSNFTVKAIYSRVGALDDGPHTEKVGDYTWSFVIDDCEAEIVACDENGKVQWQRAVDPYPCGNFTVPSTLGGCPVTKLGHSALYNCHQLTSLSLPDTLREIGDYAMWECGLTTLELPANVASIGDQAFATCWNLRNLSVSADNPWFTSDDGVLYDKDKTDLYFWPRAKKIELTATLKNIRPYACYCNYATQNNTLAFPAGVTNVGNYAFSNCNLSRLELNEGLVSIGSYAFRYNNYLRFVTIPSTVTTIESYVFNSCSSLTSVYFKGNAPKTCSNYLYGDAPSGLTTYVAPESTGWLSAQSSDLPESWPAKDRWGNGAPRAIGTWTTYPNVAWRVTFDIGETAKRIGGGELEQTVIDGESAIAPEIECEGQEFVGWNASLANITAPTTISAIFTENGTPMISNAVATVAPAWSKTATITYDGLCSEDKTNVLFRVYCLKGGEWHAVSSVSGDLSVLSGQHTLSIDLSEFDLDPGETVFKLSVIENRDIEVEIQNDESWELDLENSFNGTETWRSPYVRGDGTTLRATVNGQGTLTFVWKMSKSVYGEAYFNTDDADTCLYNRGYWSSRKVVLSTPGEHELEWYYENWEEEEGGDSGCLWVANIQMKGGDVIGEVPVRLTIAEPSIELSAEQQEGDMVRLYSDNGDATIRYTLDGSVPTADSTIYTSPIAWSVFRNIRAVAMADDGSWSEMLEGSQFVRIAFDPALGTTDARPIIRRIGDIYGKLPVAVRGDYEFLGWSPEYGSDWGDYYVIGEEDEVESWVGTLYAVWDVPANDILNPDKTLDGVEINGDNDCCVSRDCWTFGYLDEENYTFVATNRVWTEYVCMEGWVDEGETNTLLTVNFEGAGVLEFAYLSKYCVSVFLDGKACTIKNNRIKVLGSGSHRLEFSVVGDENNDWDYGCDWYGSLRIGGMTWTKAPASVNVKFDAFGGTVTPETKSYNCGETYGSFPTVTPRDGYTFLGWFTDPAYGQQVSATDLLDFEAETLYAHWQTSLEKALNVDGGNLAFASSGATGWLGLSGISHGDRVAASSGWLEWNETNVLTTTVSGKGVLSFWWRKDEDSLSAHVWLTVDGEPMELNQVVRTHAGDGWRKFAICLTGAGTHTISWSAALDSAQYNAMLVFGEDNIESVRDIVASYQQWGMDVLAPGMWIDEVNWSANADQTDVVQWAYSSAQVTRKLPGLASTMAEAMTERIDKNAADYEARVRRAIVRLKELSENTAIFDLLARYGYTVSDDWTKLLGAFSASNAPATNEGVDELATRLLPVLDQILVDLDAIPTTWKGTVALSPDDYPVDDDVYIDSADVTTFRAVAHGCKAATKIAQGYDLTLSNAALEEELGAAASNTIESVLADHPLCAAAIRDADALVMAKAELKTCLELYATIDRLFRERTHDIVHFIEYDSAYDDCLRVIADKAKLAITALDGVVTVDCADFACFEGFRDTNEVHRVTLKPFFEGNILRTQLPRFDGNSPITSSIPDITFAGTFPDWTMENRKPWLDLLNASQEEAAVCMVYFNANGGVLSETSRRMDVGAKLGELPSVSRQGYTFQGWFTELSGGEQVQTTTVIAKTQTFYARWQKMKFRVVIDGSVDDGCEYGKTINAETFASITNGWTNIVCTGWIGTGNVPKTGTGNSVSFVVRQASSLQWKYATNYWVSVVSGVGGNVSVKGSDGKTVGNELWTLAGTELTAKATANAGYLFAGWRDGETGEDYSPESTLNMPVTHPWVLEAAFTSKVFVVTFEIGDHGSRTGGGELSQIVEWGKAASAPTVASNAGYAFTGWDVAFSSVKASLTVKAKYSTSGYAITYADVRGHSNANPTSYTVEDEIVFTALENADGWEFLGWSPEKIERGSTGDKTVTALWEQFKSRLVVEDGIAKGIEQNGSQGDALNIVDGVMTIPEGVTNVAAGAFYENAEIVSVALPSTLKSIGAYAFGNCANLATLTGGENLESISAGAFNGTAYLAAERAKAGFGFLQIGGCVIGWRGTPDAACAIPDGVTSVSEGALSGLPCVTLTLPTSLKTLGVSAFRNCTSLKYVNGLGAGVAVGANAFTGTPYLDGWAMPKLVVEDGVAKGIEQVVGHDDISAIIDGVLTIPEGVTNVAASAFADNTELTKVVLPSTIKSIGARAFLGCRNLAEIDGLDRASSIGLGALRNTPLEASVEFQMFITDGVLEGYNGICPEELSLPDETEVIAAEALSDSLTLKTLHIPSGVTNIGAKAFANCTALKEVRFHGNAPTTVAKDVFSGTPTTLEVLVLSGSIGWKDVDSQVLPTKWPTSDSQGRKILWSDVSIIVHQGELTDNDEWSPQYVHIIRGYFSVRSGKTLTVAPGTVVKFDRSARLYINTGAKLLSVGTSAQPIVFTSYKDDVHGGDTNSDGDSSVARPGDWYQISVGGIGTFDHVRVYYNSSVENCGGIDTSYGGAITFDNSIIAHTKYECVNAHGGGSFTARNSAFWDSSLAFGYYGNGTVKAYNCIFADLQTAIRQNGKLLVNCIFWKCDSFADQYYGSGSYFKYCLFYNPSSSNKFRAGRDGNIWGDPLFTDPDNGDFTIAANSPCVDAGNGEYAPERDAFGQPRMDVRRVHDTGVADANGVVPDIGIYEVPGSTTLPLPDLAVVSVSGPASVQAGKSATITYVVTNCGESAAIASVRDVVKLTGVDAELGGASVTVGSIVQSYDIPAGGAATLTATLDVPSVRSGNWRFVVDVNSDRDIYEENFVYNTGRAESSTQVLLPSLASGSSLTVGGMSVAGYSLEGLPLAGGVVRIKPSGNARVSAYVGNGFVPSSEQSDAVGTVLSDGTVVILVPARTEGEQSYVTIENVAAVDARVAVTIGEVIPEIWGVSPKTLSNVGSASVTVSGLGLTAEATFELGSAKATEVTKLDETHFLCTFDLKWAAVGQRDLVVTLADGSTVKSVNAVDVQSGLSGAQLEAWLDLPSAVRDGRVFTGYVCYRNSGDTPMRMPVFAVRRNDSKTQLALSADATFSTSPLFIGGIASVHPAGILYPGDEGRIPFCFKPYGSYSLELTSTLDNDNTEAFPAFGGTDGYLSAMSTAATRLNLRGRTVWSVLDFVDQAKWEMNGVASAAVSGHLRDVRTKEPLAGVSIALVTTNESASAVATCTTDGNGYFQLGNVDDGTYRFGLDGGSVLAGVGTNLVTVSNRADVNGYEVTAMPGGKITGHVTGEDGNAVPFAPLKLVDEVGVVATATGDAYGAYAFDDVGDGTYSVLACSVDGYIGTSVTNVEVSTAAKKATVEFVLERGGTISGRVTSGGAVVTNGTVRAIMQNGDGAEVECGVDGAYCFGGLPAGTYAVQFYSADLISEQLDVVVAVGQDATHDIVASERPIFQPMRTMGFGSLETQFFMTDYARSTNVTSWAWDFDSDGTVDSTDSSPTHTYKVPGTNTVTLTIVENGNRVTSVYRNCVIVEPEIETEYQDNAIVFDVNSGTLQVIEVTDDGLVLSGQAGIALEPGVAIMGQYNGEWFVRRIVSVAGNSSRWTLSTQKVGMSAIYRQFAASALVKVEPQKKLQAANGTRKLQRAISSDPTDVQLISEGGVDFTRTVTGDLYVEYVEKQLAGSSYLRVALVGELAVKEECTFHVTSGVQWKKSMDLPCNNIRIPVAAPIPVTVSPDFDVSVAVRATAKAVGSQSSEMKLRAQFGFEMTDRRISWLPPFTCEQTAPSKLALDVEGGGSVGLSFAPGIKVRICEVMSLGVAPQVGVEGSFKASFENPPEFKIEGSAGVRLEANLWDVDFWIFSQKIGVSKTFGMSYELASWKGPDPDFTMSPSSGDAPLTVQFLDSSDGDTVKILTARSQYRVKGYEWDLAVAKSSVANPTATYTKEGKYPVSLRALGYFITGPNRKRDTVIVGKQDDPDDGDKNRHGGGDGYSYQSWDPNEMRGPDGLGERRLVEPGEWMNYTVFFENKAEAEAAAQEVRVNTTLSPYLDWSTFEMGEISFAGQVDNGLDGYACGVSETKMNGTNYYVRTEVDLDETTGELAWYQRIVDRNGDAGEWPADPLAGFLAPNDATGCGEGHYTYRIKVRDDAPANVVISNSASIVFDYNAAIITDPAWWNTVAGYGDVTLSAEGLSTNLVLIAGTAFPELPSPAARKGYAFDGWYFGPNGTGTKVVAGETLVPTGKITLHANWIKTGPDHEISTDDLVVASNFTAAVTYYGYLRSTTDDAIIGTVQVKAAKAKKDKKSGAMTSKLTISVQTVSSTKKISISGIYNLGINSEQSFTAKGSTISLLLGTTVMSGSFNGYRIEGVVDVFTAKDAASKAAASAANAAYVGTYNLIASEGTFAVSVAKKGKVKVTGTTAAGKKVSVSTQLIVGNGIACVPVLAPKLKLAFAVWLDGNDVSADGLTDAVAGKAGSLAAGAKFSVDADALAELLGATALKDYFPSDVAILQNKTKWIVMPDAKGKATKAGKVALAKDGTIDAKKSKIDGYNVSALKLTYTAKTGAFKGSFKTYYIDGKGKLKNVAFTVAGVLVDGVGYGTATAKKFGSVSIKVE